MNVRTQKISRFLPDNKIEEQEILLLNEHKLLIKINGKNWCSLVCTDQNLMELVFGHLLSSGLIEKKDEIKDVYFCETKNTAFVTLNTQIIWNGNTKNEESCCPNNEHFLQNADLVPLKKLPSVPTVPCQSRWIFNLAKTFSKDSAIHKHTSGTHICILAKQGEPLFIAEDIGRHTALDKALGYMLLNNLPPDKMMLFTSGRVPVDMVEKVIRAKVPVLISKSVPTAQSVNLANEYNLNLIFRAWQDSYDKVQIK